ncbi:MAG: DUF2877 domain-containing protein [Clostridium sp.]|nr:DUF2877 domain-containing protein [Clostridium sp.]
MVVLEIDAELLKIREGEKNRITLTAVFENSCYGFNGDRLITVLPKEKSLLPRSLTIDGAWKSHGFKVGQTLIIGNGHYDNLRLNEETKVLDLSLQDKEVVNLDKKKEQIKRFLAQSKEFLKGIGKVYLLKQPDKNPPLELATNSMELKISKRIDDLIQSLKDKKEITAGNVIGYGLGLTPSADDFILGMLSTLEGEEQKVRRNILKDYILKHYDGTTQVSQYMLYYGMEHYTYPKFLCDFLLKPWEENDGFHEFLAHGSTSGTDLLTGIMVGMEILMDGKP